MSTRGQGFNNLYYIVSHDDGTTWSDIKAFKFSDDDLSQNTGSDGAVVTQNGTILVYLEEIITVNETIATYWNELEPKIGKYDTVNMAYLKQIINVAAE